MTTAAELREAFEILETCELSGGDGPFHRMPEAVARIKDAARERLAQLEADPELVERLRTEIAWLYLSLDVPPGAITPVPEATTEAFIRVLLAALITTDSGETE